jgi:hypothetical protein
VAIGAKDMTTRIYGVGRYLNFGLQSLGSHRDAIVACFFEEDSLDITTIGRCAKEKFALLKYLKWLIGFAETATSVCGSAT